MWHEWHFACNRKRTRTITRPYLAQHVWHVCHSGYNLPSCRVGFLVMMNCFERHLIFLHDRPWISPWIKSISNELDITIHVIALQLFQAQIKESIKALPHWPGIHRSPVNFPHKGPVTRKMFPFDNVTMIFGIWIPTRIKHSMTWRSHRQTPTNPNPQHLHTHTHTHTHIHFNSRSSIWKCRLENGVHFVSASIC